MLIIYFVLTCLMLAVCISDITRYLIPNRLVLALIALYPVMVLVSPARPDWGMACVIATATFVVGLFVLFRFMGGGDVKLLSAASLYVGKSVYLDFIVSIAMLGGFGTLLLLALRAVTPYVFIRLGKSGAAIPRVLTPKEPVPYGVAIAAAFLILLWSGKLPGLEITSERSSHAAPAPLHRTVP